MVGRLYHMGGGPARERWRELLERFELTDAADRLAKTYSGGMRRRLDLAAALVARPPVLVLDEPTTGLDPAGRREVWQAIGDLAARGTTVLLTTHYLDEADKLCDRIGVIDHGRNIVEDTPDGLKRRIGNERLEVVAGDPDDLPVVAEVLGRAAADGQAATVDRAALSASVAVTDGVQVLIDIAVELRGRGVAVADLGLRRPTLDEAFLRLTGSGATAPGGADADRADPDRADPGGTDPGGGADGAGEPRAATRDPRAVTR
jgi:ABC-2 type transport system ATP-binding protein